MGSKTGTVAPRKNHEDVDDDDDDDGDDDDDDDDDAVHEGDGVGDGV